MIRKTVDYLKSRHHPEKPHLSLVGPPHPNDYRLIWKTPKGARGHYDVVEGDEDEFLEEFDESLRTRWPGWLFGSDFEFRRVDDSFQAKVDFSFYVRVKPDYDERRKWDEAAYTHVKASLEYRGQPARLTGEVLLVPGAGGRGVPLRIQEDLSADAIAIIVAPQAAMQLLNQQRLRAALQRVASIGLGVTPSLEVDLRPIGGNYLTAELYDSNGNHVGKYHYCFCILVGRLNNVFKAYLINLGGAPQSSNASLLRQIHENPFKVYTYNSSDNMSRWALGYLLEVKGKVEFRGGRPAVEWDEYGLKGAYPVNALILEKEDAGYELRDYHVVKEELPPIKRQREPAELYLQRLARQIGGGDSLAAFMRALGRALASMAGVAQLHFYTYQSRAIEEILASLGLIQGRRHKAVAITARTAGGKTYAFLVPILISIFLDKLRGRDKGVKAVLTYPTKALANDQVEEVANILYHLERQLREEGAALNISFGCLHGATYDLDDIRFLMGRGNRAYLPVKCPEHGSPIYIEEENGRPHAKCPSAQACPFATFLNHHMRKTREEVYFDPPDLLITDEDMINRIISGTAKEHRGRRGRAPWYEWQLLGYPYQRCRSCLHTYPPALSIRKCRICGEGRARIELVGERLSRPNIIVLDETHQIYGSFGIQVHHMLSLLEQVIGRKPLYVLSSATLARAGEVAASLLGLHSGQVEVINAEPDGGGGSPTHRIFLLVMPKAYTIDASTVRLLRTFYSEFFAATGKVPKGIVFTNTLAQNNELTQQLRADLPDALSARVVVDGHSTDYHGERERKELLFKGGGIDLFVATSTLEVGIDYGEVEFVTIYGVPAKVSSFIQRIGRAGRKRDAAVFVVFDHRNPLNYSYYENYKILCDGFLRDRAIGREVIQISPINDEAIRRAVARWAIAEVYRLCAGDRSLSKVLVNGISATGERIRLWSRVARHISSAGSFPQSLSTRLVDRQILENERRRICDEIINNRRNWPGISQLVGALGENTLYNLRAADEEVVVTFPKLSGPERRRLRELRYVVRHCLPGQVMSYRGLFFTVYAFETKRQVSIGGGG